jgi:hypothetical protein
VAVAAAAVAEAGVVVLVVVAVIIVVVVVSSSSSSTSGSLHDIALPVDIYRSAHYKRDCLVRLCACCPHRSLFA